jgi:hypothetical protein
VVRSGWPFLIVMVVCLERWTRLLVGLLVAVRFRPPLPFDLLLPLDLRRANRRPLSFCAPLASLRAHNTLRPEE